MGALGGVVSGVVAAAAEGDEAARVLLLAGALSGRRDGASLGALSRGGASNVGASRGAPAGVLAGIDVAAPPADFRVRALDGAASVENMTTADTATRAELEGAKERPLWAAFFFLITGLAQVLNSGERLHACRGISSWIPETRTTALLSRGYFGVIRKV
ncbi:MAG: hypothetical protein WCO36_08235 [Actinomycetes bacterium]